MELTGSEEMPFGSGYLGVQCRDLFYTLAPQLFLQRLGHIHSQRTLAEVSVRESQSKPTPPGIFFKTFEVSVQPEILRFAEVLKSRLCTCKVLWAFHVSNDLFDLLPMLFLHDSLSSTENTTLYVDAIFFLMTKPFSSLYRLPCILKYPGSNPFSQENIITN